MSIEDDLFNAFRFAEFGEKTDPTKMIHSIVRNIEIAMLSQMQARIHARLSVLQGVPEDTSMDPFSILGVDMDATREEVDKAYREKAKAAHPDKGGNNMEMVRVNAAYEAIRLFKGWKEK